MADKRTGNFAANHGDAGQADPFAGLTRVAGFDRDPNRNSIDDFDVNLEQELMLDLDCPASAPRAAANEIASDDLPMIRLSRPGAPAPSVEGPMAADLASQTDDELENEFNALLGNTHMQPSSEYEAAEVEATLAVEADRYGEFRPAPFESVVESYEIEPEPAQALQASAPLAARAPRAASLDDDPFAMLAAMAEKYKVSADADDSWRNDIRSPAVAATPVEAPAYAPMAQPMPAAARVVAPVPQIETVDVVERAAVVSDDLDIPELELPEQAQVRTGIEDIDAEFNDLLNQMSTPEPASHPAYEAISSPRAYESISSSRVYEPIASHRAAPSSPAVAPSARRDDDLDLSFTADDLADPFEDVEDRLNSASRAAGRQEQYFDDGFDDDVPVAAYDQQGLEQKPRRGLMIAAIAGGIAVLGVAGALAISMMGSAQGGAPTLVKSDHTPIKVRPVSAGGMQAPSQTSGVYETVARGSQSNQPSQDKLLSAAEDPIELPDELPVNADEDFAEVDQPKSEDRIEQITEETEGEAETLAVAPRKVRTMVVKPDGSLVPAESPARPQAAAEQAAPAKTAAKKPAAAKPTAQAEQSPADVIDQAAADKVPANVATDETTAAIEPQAPVAGWTVQIASEGSEEAAQAAYKKLAAKHGKVLGGKPVSIVKADIAGKGVRWRVRVPAETRGDAASLCSKYKSAGGSCFVSKS